MTRVTASIVLLVIFPFMSSNIPLFSVYSVFISQLIRYARAYYDQRDILIRGQLPTSNFLSRKLVKPRHTASMKTFDARYNLLVQKYSVSISQHTRDILNMTLSL